MRNSAWNRAVRWPLWSWRNLTLTAAAALVLLALAGRLTSGVDASAAAPAPPPSMSMATGPTVPSTSPPPGTPTGAPTTLPSAARQAPPSADAGSPVQVAAAFVTAWATTTHGSGPWLAGMKPWATTSLVSSLTGTDPAQVPATHLTGDPALRSTHGTTAAVSVPTDGGRVLVQLVDQAGRWKAAALSPDDAPPGAPTPSLGPATVSTRG